MMMTPGFDPASVAEVAGESADEGLRQFEPDNDGTWDPVAADPAAVTEVIDDPQWIVWADAMLESAWADGEVAATWRAATRVARTR